MVMEIQDKKECRFFPADTFIIKTYFHLILQNFDPSPEGRKNWSPIDELTMYLLVSFQASLFTANQFMLIQFFIYCKFLRSYNILRRPQKYGDISELFLALLSNFK